MKYVIQEAERFNIDKEHIIINGESSGAWVAAGLAMLLAQKDESDLVKCVVTETYPLSTEWLTRSDEELSETAKWAKKEHLNTVKTCCSDWEK